MLDHDKDHFRCVWCAFWISSYWEPLDLKILKENIPGWMFPPNELKSVFKKMRQKRWFPSPPKEKLLRWLWISKIQLFSPHFVLREWVLKLEPQILLLRVFFGHPNHHLRIFDRFPRASIISLPKKTVSLTAGDVWWLGPSSLQVAGFMTQPRKPRGPGSGSASEISKDKSKKNSCQVPKQALQFNWCFLQKFDGKYDDLEGQYHWEKQLKTLWI